MLILSSTFVFPIPVTGLAVAVLAFPFKMPIGLLPTVTDSFSRSATKFLFTTSTASCSTVSVIAVFVCRVPFAFVRVTVITNFSTFSGGSGGGKDEQTEDEPINIFSVASGHLYERFLRIMMLSVIKHTKSPVKFWFLKNYLSPSFKVSVIQIWPECLDRKVLLCKSNPLPFVYRTSCHAWPKNTDSSTN